MSDKQSSGVAADSDGQTSDGGPKLTRRSFIGRSAGVALAVGGLGGFISACGTGGSGDGGEVVVLSWESYVTPEIKKAFEEATGITMKGIPAESDQDMFTKIKAGGGGQYDVVFGNCGWSPIYAENDLIETIDVSEIPSSDQLFPVFREDDSLPYVESPGKLLMFPNMWAALSLIWNTEAPYQPAKPLSWNALWDAPSGKVVLHGSPEDFIAMSGLAMGVPRDEVYSMTGDTLDQAADHLGDLQPFQISKSSDDFTARTIATQKAYVGFASSLGIGHRVNEQFGKGKEIAKTAVPKEGSLGWVDGAHLVKDAKNRENAIKFIDFFNGNKQNQDYLWDTYFYSQCNQQSTERIIGRGGEDATVAKSLGSDKPETAQELVFQTQPDDPSAWAAAYDRVIG